MKWLSLTGPGGVLAAAGAVVRGGSDDSDEGLFGFITELKLINFAWLTVLASVGLSLVGVYAIDVAEQPIAQAAMAPTAAKQLAFLFIGVLAAGMIALPHVRVLGWVAWPVFAICIGLLVFMLVPAVPAWLVTPRNGARAWINLGVVDFQPSELTKIAYILVVAHYLRFRHQHRRFAGLLIPGLITAVPVGLITVQPDLGTASLFGPALFAVLIAAGARVRHLLLIVVLALAIAPAVYPFLQPHQKQRLVGMMAQFTGDQSTAQGINYQSFTAQDLIGSGGWTGRPDAAARALVRHNRLPEAHNDMIFAVICARFGMLGGLGVLALYGLWLAGALLTAAACREPMGRLIAVGLAAFVGAQVVINVGMNIGIVPIIGITLPFISYGGSSMVTCWLMAGLVMSCGLHKARPPFRESFDYSDDDPGWDRKPNDYGRRMHVSGRVLTR
ncbi:MAG: cell division protein FtsW (lipid II flippase) [Phycisphaerales bacterium]